MTEVDALVADLWRFWRAVHSEHCWNLTPGHDGECAVPIPESLVGRPMPEDWREDLPR